MWKSLGCLLLFLAFTAVTVWGVEYPGNAPWYIDYAALVSMFGATAALIAALYNWSNS